jgi:glutamine amidotransferase
MMIAIIDYGASNLRSVANALEALGTEFFICSDPSDLPKADGMILPGVGAFADGMGKLERMGMKDALESEVLEKKKPYLGICLGMQFLGEESEEHGLCRGFGWMKGRVRKIKHVDGFKIPHMGWNDTELREDVPIFSGLGKSGVFYYVHSYFFDAEEKDTIIATTFHAEKLIAGVQKGNIIGVQFHPEKSQGAGLMLLKNFVRFVKDG